MAWDNESKVYADKLERLVTGIDKIMSLQGNRLITDELQERLNELKNNAMILLPKLKNGEFEIAVVGLEKTGKSSVCNALIGVSALPTDELRCTYTSTCIKPGLSCSAIVTFYDKNEFDRDLKEKLKEIGVENSDLYSIDNLTHEKYVQLFENCPEDKKDKYDDSLNLDISDTLTYKSSLVRLLGNSSITFNSSQMKTDEFKKYITKPEYAIAVKNVTLISDELKEMPNAILYDVPGFNSPTLMHQEQTLQKMKTADAIVYIAKGKEPSLTKEVRKLLKIFKKSDSDGALLSEKLFVFANRMDESEDIPHVLEKTQHEWIIEPPQIMPNTEESRKRIFAGSANAHLGNNVVNGLEIREKLAKHGVDKYGINEIRNALTEYYHTTRFDVLKKRVDKILYDFEDAISFAINVESGSSSNQEYNEILLNAFVRIQQEFENRLNTIKEERNKDIHKNEPLKNDLISKISTLITTENFGIKDEEIELTSKKIGDLDAVQQPQKVDGKIREIKFGKMYKEYEERALLCASDMHDDLYDKITKELISIIGISDKDNERKIAEDFEETFLAHDKGEDYYGSLIERFSRDIFEILIKFQHGTDRLKKFKSANTAANYFSLGVFYNATISAENSALNSDSENETNIPSYISVTPSEAQLWRMLLYPGDIQDKNEKDTVIEKLKSYTGLKKLNSTIEKLIDKFISIKGTSAVEEITKLFADFVVGQPEIAAVSLVKDILTNFIHEHGGESQNMLEEVWDNNKYLNDLSKKHEDYSYKMVKEEFACDINALRTILLKAVIPAVNLDRAFASRQTRIIDNVIRKLKGEDFIKFISRNIDIIELSNVEKINAERAQRDLDIAVAKEITEMKNNILAI